MPDSYVGELHKVPGIVRIEWDIKNYLKISDKKRNEDCFISPTFSYLAATWRFLLFPEKYIQIDPYYSAGCVSLYLQKMCSKSENHRISYKMGIKINRNTEVCSFFVENKCFKMNEMSGEEQFLRTISLFTMKADDTLTVFLHAFPKISEVAEVMSQADLSNTVLEGVDVLSKDMKDLYLNEQDYDFSIRVKERDFKVHKLILSARSPVLASMLKHDMAEKNNGYTDIVDFEPDVFEKFIRYLYSGRVDDLSWNNVTHLYALGDKYDVEQLKNLCCVFIEDNICIEEFCDVIAFAVEHDESSVLRRSQEYFLKNVSFILQTTKWKDFLLEKPGICNDLFIMLTSQK